MDRVAVVVIVLGGVDAPLSCNGVGPPGGVMEGEDLDVVTEFAEAGGCGGPGEAGAHDDDLELPLVRRVDELHGELVVLPLVGDGADRDFGVEVDHLSSPKAMKRGGMAKPTVIRADTAMAKTRRAALKRGWLIPTLWNIDQAPWKRWTPRRVTAST